jgi:hypothetical protein
MILVLKLMMPLSFGRNLINHKILNIFMINNSKNKINLKKMTLLMKIYHNKKNSNYKLKIYQ